MLTGLPPIRKSTKKINAPTEAEKAKIEKLVEDGTLHEGNLRQFFDRFIHAPERKTAIEYALDPPSQPKRLRFFQGMKNMFVEGPGLVIEHYEKHGIFRGTWRIITTIILVPYYSWAEIFGGEPGLGDTTRTLCGAATVFLIVLLILDWYFIWFGD